MATRGRESIAKEKRVASPSMGRKSDIVQQRRSPNPPSAGDRKKASTSTETRNVPSYLKATVSSGPDASPPQNLKKQLSSDKNKPSLSRRRSFDKPPSPSQIPSNRLHIVSPTSSEKSLKGSSSFSSRTSSLSKPKDVAKSQVLHSSLPRSSSSVKKGNKGITGNKQTNGPTRIFKSNKKPSVSGSPKQVSQQKILADDELTNAIHEQDNNKVQAADILSLDEDDKQQEDDLLHSEVEFEDDSEIQLSEPSPTIVGDLQMPFSYNEVDMISQGDANIDENINNDLLRGEEYNGDQETKNNQYQEENTPIASDVLDTKLDREREDLRNEEIAENVKEEAVILQEKETIEEKREEKILCNETKVEENEKVSKVEESKKDEEGKKVTKVEESANTVIKHQQGVNHGKKDITAYNDVIEETANKLREQRKNKVKALVGAFETVISLESDSPME